MTRQWLCFFAVLLLIHWASAACDRSLSVIANINTLLAEETCSPAKICLVDSLCKVIKTFPDNQTSFNIDVNSSIADLSLYPNTELQLDNIRSDTFSRVIFPAGLLSLKLNLDTMYFMDYIKLPAGLKNLYKSNLTQLTTLNRTMNTCTVKNPPTALFQWPPSLDRLELIESELKQVPVNLPRTLSYLDLTSNYIHALVDQDWRSLKALKTSAINTSVNVQISKNLTYWECFSCQLKNFTVDASTYSALSALEPYNQTRPGVGIVIDAASANDTDCKSRNGTIKPLWPTVNGSVCVVSNINPTTHSPDISSSTPSSYTIPIIIATIAVIIVMVAICSIFFFRRRKAMDITEETTWAWNSDIEQLIVYRLDEKQLKITKRKPLAVGAYGEVYLGSYAGTQVVVKRNKDKSKSALEILIAEIKLLAKLDSPYIVKFIGVSWIRPIDMECVIEYMNLGDLRSYLANHTTKQFTWAEKAKCIESIVHGLEYLHTFDPPIIHRDLKSNNVLLDSEKGTKITDFGVSKESEDDATRTNGVGTYQWMAPEVITDCHYTVAADIYSFGVLLTEFSTHKVPYSGMTHSDTGRSVNQHYVINGVAKGDVRPEFDLSSPQWILDVGNKCLATNPGDRPTILALSVLARKFTKECSSRHD